MAYQLPPSVEAEIVKYAKARGIGQVVLFGSRARGDNGPRSDVDLAVCGGEVLDFHEDLEERAWTLLSFDVVDMGRPISEALKKEIQRDGVVLYEKA